MPLYRTPISSVISHTLYTKDTKADLEAAQVPNGVDAVRINGYTAAGDGGAALYKKVAVEPSHLGKIQSADGAWWEISMPFITPKMMGAVGGFDDATMTGTDDVTAIQNANAVARDMGLPLVFDHDKYGLSAPFVIAESDRHIYGIGLPILVAIGNHDIIQIDTRTTTLWNGSIRNLWFMRRNATYNLTIGIHVLADSASVTGARHWTFEHIRGTGVWNVIKFDNTGGALHNGLNQVGWHSFNDILDVHVPLDADLRYPNAVILFDGRTGAHNRISGGQYRSTDVGIRVGDGGTLVSIGDLIINDIHFVLGNGAVNLIGPSGSSTYRTNIGIWGCQFDVLDLYLIKARNVELLRAYPNQYLTGVTHDIDATVTHYWLDTPNGFLRTSSTWVDDYDVTTRFRKIATFDTTINHNGGRFETQGWINVGAIPTATVISSGTIVASRTFTVIDTEGGAASDILDSATGGKDGDILILQIQDAARDVTITHFAGAGGAGTFRCHGQVDKLLSSVSDEIWFRKKGGIWCQITFSDNIV